MHLMLTTSIRINLTFDFSKKKMLRKDIKYLVQIKNKQQIRPDGIAASIVCLAAKHSPRKDGLKLTSVEFSVKQSFDRHCQSFCSMPIECPIAMASSHDVLLMSKIELSV